MALKNLIQCTYLYIRLKYYEIKYKQSYCDMESAYFYLYSDFKILKNILERCKKHNLDFKNEVNSVILIDAEFKEMLMKEKKNE